MLRSQLFSYFFSTLIKGGKNSINPISEHIAFGHYFPKEWTSEYIFEQLDNSKRNIKDIQLILNRLG